jgi:6-phosphogluconate dehydrogenase
MHYQGQLYCTTHLGQLSWFMAILQSVFLSDITKAYEKTPNLESLLFDDFFNKGLIILSCCTGWC